MYQPLTKGAAQILGGGAIRRVLTGIWPTAAAIRSAPGARWLGAPRAGVPGARRPPLWSGAPAEAAIARGLGDHGAPGHERQAPRALLICAPGRLQASDLQTQAVKVAREIDTLADQDVAATDTTLAAWRAAHDALATAETAAHRMQRAYELGEKDLSETPDHQRPALRGPAAPNSPPPPTPGTPTSSCCWTPTASGRTPNEGMSGAS